MRGEREILFKAEGITKQFPGVRALNDVNIEIYKNEILGLSGENGAGKSTLMKVIAGVYSKDSGRMLHKGREYNPLNYREGTSQGISMVFQEQNLVPNLFGYENIFLSHEKFFIKKNGFLDTRTMIEKTKMYFEQFEIDADPAKRVSTYSFHQRQLVEIVRAFMISELYRITHPFILLDEPTAALSEKERELMFSKVTKYSENATFCLISHRLSEMMTYCNRILVLRDGEMVGEVNPKTSEEHDLHTLMVGREVSRDIYGTTKQDDDYCDEKAMEVKGLTQEGLFEDINIELNKGMILGLGGLVGCGKRDLGKAIYGIAEYQSGTIHVNGSPVKKGKISSMVKQRVGYIPAERKGFGIIEYLPVSWNISLPSIFTLSNKLLLKVDRKKEKNLIDKYIKRFRIKASPEDMCFSLSGGNQQKVVLAKWIAKNLDIIILDNPTRGVDVGAKEEIYSLLRKIVKEGVSILMITDDLLELIGLSNQIVIMKEGKITDIRGAGKEAKPTEKELVQYMV
ncbi:MAG: sugar ABC transporter ATP-binding protein [Candidatus Theseobacter exili]|nr:sugar ABC transporter ATP-binding protein [Candidatus Theseobacter exili]